MSQNSKPEERRLRAQNVNAADVEALLQDKRKRDEAIKRKAAKQGKRNR
jgi:hypothetical protein